MNSLSLVSVSAAHQPFDQSSEPITPLNPTVVAEEGKHRADFPKMEEGLKSLQEMVGKMVQESRATCSAIEKLTQESRTHQPHPAGAWCFNGGHGVALPDDQYHAPTRFCCVELRFPKFDGSGLDVWLCKAQHFFDVDGTPPDAKIRLASIHLEGRALVWHQNLMRSNSYATLGTWDEYVGALKIRFGESAFDDSLRQLIKLTQDSSVRDYMDRFDALLNKVSLPEEDVLRFFLGGLKELIRYRVMMFRPTSLLRAMELARQLEVTVSAEERRFQVQPVAILGQRMVREDDKDVVEVLVEWSNDSPENARWENYEKLKLQFPEFGC